MISSKQSLPITTSFPFPYFQLNFNSIGLTKYLPTIISQVSLLFTMAMVFLVSPVSNAAPPENVHHDFVNSTPGNVSPKSGNTEKFARGRILVIPRAGLPKKAFDAILSQHHGKSRKIGQSDIYIVEIPEFSEEAVVMALQQNPHIKLAELDYISAPTLTPNDPYFSIYEWHLPKIGAPSAWDIAQGEGITIAILDSGVDDTHPDLANNLMPGWNFFDNNSNIRDFIGHGTFVAGTAAATTSNSIGVASIAGKAKIMPLRITDNNGYGYQHFTVSALIYAADHGARIANISYKDQTSKEAVRSAAQYMKDKNGLVFVSADNTGMLENYSVTTSMIAVSATDELDQLTSFSSYGNYVSLSAPGKNIWSTAKMTNQIPYGPAGGTSISSPLAAGVAALMMSSNPKLSNNEIESLLFSTAVDLGSPGRDMYFGYGRVDAAAAVKAAKAATPTLDTEAPHITIINPLEGATLSGLIPVDIDATDNIGVTRAELWINNSSVAIDTTQPFSFSWDSTGSLNGSTNLEVRVFDAANNMASSMIVVNVNNSTSPPTIDTQAPAMQIVNPVAGSVSGTIAITLNASDNNGATGISLAVYIDGILKATGTGSTMSTSWNTRTKGTKAGAHTILAVAKDSAGNTSTATVNVNVVK